MSAEGEGAVLLVLRRALTRLVRGFWAVDRALGGSRPPGRSQLFAARRPVVVGVGLGAPFGVLMTAAYWGDADSTGDVVFLLGASCAFPVVYTLTAYGERARQRRLERLGIWRPPGA